ncbi:MAG: FHA domain-containing protein [Chloroflexota bacterium]
MLGQLVVVHGGATSFPQGRSFPLYGTTTVGRGPDNAIVLSDGYVSTSHAVIDYRDGGWWLSDLDSRNGTWVNGERITREVRLHPGDLVAFGPVKVELAP